MANVTQKVVSMQEQWKLRNLGPLWEVRTLSSTSHEFVSGLYMLCQDLSIKTIIPRDTVKVSNGIAWSSDNKTDLIEFRYYIDSPLKRVDAFDYDLETGEWSNRRTVIQIERGYPDGMTIDSQNNLWIAHWAGGCITKWNPATGELLRTVEMPVSKVTSCVFGGKV